MYEVLLWAIKGFSMKKILRIKNIGTFCQKEKYAMSNNYKYDDFRFVLF